jgi:hypothetical protein
LTNSTIKNKSFTVGLLSVATSFIQLYAYGWGFLKAYIFRKIFKKEMF